MATTKTTPPALSDPISSDLKAILRALKLGKLLDTLPERLTLAKQQHLAHADFLELVLADEVSRRGGVPVFQAHALVLGPVGVGKTHLATALGHIAVRRRVSVHMSRADKLFKRLKAARLDNSVEAEMRRLAHVQLLIVDDFCLQALDATETADFYELVVERHRKTATVLTSNREPSEWLTMMADPLLAQSAVDRLTSTAHELVVEGESYRRRQRPTTTATKRGNETAAKDGSA